MFNYIEHTAGFPVIKSKFHAAPRGIVHISFTNLLIANNLARLNYFFTSNINISVLIVMRLYVFCQTPWQVLTESPYAIVRPVLLRSCEDKNCKSRNNSDIELRMIRKLV